MLFRIDYKDYNTMKASPPETNNRKEKHNKFINNNNNKRLGSISITVKSINHSIIMKWFLILEW